MGGLVAKSELGLYLILHYFADYLTGILTLGPCSYRISYLVLDSKMWEKFKSNLPVRITFLTEMYNIYAIHIEIKNNKARHKIQIVNTARWP